MSGSGSLASDQQHAAPYIVSFAPKDAAAVRLEFKDGTVQEVAVIGREKQFPVAFYVAFPLKDRALSGYSWLDDSGRVRVPGGG